MRKITDPAKAQFKAAWGFHRAWRYDIPSIYAENYLARMKAREMYKPPAGVTLPADDEYVPGWYEAVDAAGTAMQARQLAERTSHKPGAVVEAQARMRRPADPAWVVFFGRETAASALRLARSQS